jgi:molybdopterin biosynthesis enzyme
LAVAVRQNEQRAQLVRARMRAEGEDLLLEPLAGQDSHMIVRSAAADALVLVPAGSGSLPAGAAVRYLTLGYS